MQIFYVIILFNPNESHIFPGFNIPFYNKTNVKRIENISVLKYTNKMFQYFSSLRLVNTYGVFKIIPRNRWEIGIEGSNDGINWQEYKFRFKSLDETVLKFYTPYFPRLDQQLFYEAQGGGFYMMNKLNYVYTEQNPWTKIFLKKLLENEKSVTDLLLYNPFEISPPQYIRCQVYDFSFTDFDTKMKTGNWWNKKFLFTALSTYPDKVLHLNESILKKEYHNFDKYLQKK